MIDHTRHIGIYNAGHTGICLIGAGGIGALTSMTLGKMGVHGLSIFDDDIVDEVNIATQFHCVSDIGFNKVDAAGRNTRQFSDLTAKTFNVRVTDTYILPVVDIYISAVDTVASRQEIWKSVKNVSHLAEGKRTWYLDARMGAEVFEMFVVNLNDQVWYDTGISNASDDDIPDLPCTSKATIYTACIAAGQIGVTVRRIMTGLQKPGFLHHHILLNHLSFLEM